ncbi:MAG: SUMF1/EgtB/PvdO family nonheme iron enzyme [Proteobacteria bacterium]|nr:SUMF1/EgtB/PvdO family nonheme iron enzyme [Pseudomonadota bacterium]
MNKTLTSVIVVWLSLGFFSVQAERAIGVSTRSANYGQKVALVIGNSAYRSSPLKNPRNDAEDMAAMLEKLGFEVSLEVNANRKRMRKLIRGFGQRLKKGGVGLFYFKKGKEIAGGSFQTVTDGNGGITFTSDPPDVRVYVDDVFEGRTPLTLSYSPGVYKVAGKKRGFETHRETVRIRAGQTVDLILLLDGTGRRNTPSHTQAKATAGTYTDSTTGMEFVRVKGGCFDMGDTFGEGDDDEKPVHRVCVDDFYLGKTEVTQGQWRTVMGGNPSHFKNGDAYPVEKVGWDDANKFIRKLNDRADGRYRLPTEAEWEYACREGRKRVRFGHGKNDVGPDEANFNGKAKHKKSYSRAGEYREKTTPVGSFQPNSLGLYDMSGNVWEWTTDRHGNDYYENSPETNPKGPSSGSSRVYRGGAWYNSPRDLRCSNRVRNKPGDRDDDLGFRLSRTP